MLRSAPSTRSWSSAWSRRWPRWHPGGCAPSRGAARDHLGAARPEPVRLDQPQLVGHRQRRDRVARAVRGVRRHRGRRRLLLLALAARRRPDRVRLPRRRLPVLRARHRLALGLRFRELRANLVVVGVARASASPVGVPAARLEAVEPRGRAAREVARAPVERARPPEPPAAPERAGSAASATARSGAAAGSTRRTPRCCCWPSGSGRWSSSTPCAAATGSRRPLSRCSASGWSPTRWWCWAGPACWSAPPSSRATWRPLLVMFTGVALLGAERRPRLGGTQVVALAVGLALAQCLALAAQIRRYVTGQDVHRLRPRPRPGVVVGPAGLGDVRVDRRVPGVRAARLPGVARVRRGGPRRRPIPTPQRARPATARPSLDFRLLPPRNQVI